MSLTRDRAYELFGRFPLQRILVIGDLMLDRYVYGEVSRISPEAPVPVVLVNREQSMPGGASNVAWSVQALGGVASVAGLVGTDVAAEELKSLLRDKGVCVDAVEQHEDLRTTVKTRVVAEHQQVVRVDRERVAGLPNGLIERFRDRIGTEVESVTGVILEDYGKGVMQQMVFDRALNVAAANKIPVGFDPKENHRLRVNGVTIATPNRREAFLAAGVEDRGESGPVLEDTDLRKVSEDLHRKWGPKLLLITLGSKGMLLVNDGAPTFHVPTRAREVFDVSGAGDTVIATCLLSLAAGATPEESAELANYAASVVVAKLGTATCSPEELLAQMD